MRNLTQYFLTAAVFCAATCLTPTLLAAQIDAASDYPSKPIRFIAPFVAGARTDTTARTIAAKLGERWGQQVVVDNRDRTRASEHRAAGKREFASRRRPVDARLEAQFVKNCHVET